MITRRAINRLALVSSDKELLRFLFVTKPVDRKQADAIVSTYASSFSLGDRRRLAKLSILALNGTEENKAEAATIINKMSAAPSVRIFLRRFIDGLTPPATGPAAPGVLAATTVDDTTIDLEWEDRATDETGFRVERSLTGEGSWNTAATLPADSTSFSDTELTPETDYWYRVFAVNDDGDSEPSLIVKATTAPAPAVPAAPTALSATAQSDTEIDLAWTDNATDETAYRVEQSATGSGGWSTAATLSAGVESTRISGLTAETQYFFRVIAVNDVGDSSPSNTANATTTAVPVSGTAYFESTFTGADGTGWGGMTHEVYDVSFPVSWFPLRIHNNILSLTGTTLAGAGQNRWELPAPAPTEYNFSADIHVYGVGSAAGHGITAGGTSGPMQDEYQLLWYNDRWELRKMTGGSSTVLADDVDATVTNGSVHNLRIELTDTEVVAFVDDVEMARVADTDYRGPRFGTIQFNTAIMAENDPMYDNFLVEEPGTSGTSVPAAPTLLSASAVSDTAIDLSWTDNADNETGFRVERSLDGSTGWVGAGTPSADAETFQSTGLSADTQYYYRVFAVNDEGDSLPSNVTSATTQPSAGGGTQNPGGIIETAGNYQVRPLPDPSTFLPSGVGEFTFPAPFGTTGIRLTNSAANYSTDSVFPVDYAYWRISNNHVGSNEMKVYVRLAEADGGPSIITYNKVTGAVSAPVPIFDVGSTFRNPTAVPNAHFSAVDPNKLYWAYEGEYRSVDVTTGVVTTVFDANRISTGYKLWQSNASNDDRYHSMTYRTSGYSNLGTVVYDASEDTFQLFPLVGVMDEAQVDRAGDWVVIKEQVDGTEGEDNRIINLSTEAEQVLSDPDGAGGHSDNGYGFMANADNYAANANTKVLTNLSTLAQTELYYNSNWGVQVANHLSWCHAEDPSSTPIANQYVVGSGINSTNDAHANEIIALPLDGSRTVLVIAPAMGTYAAAGGSTSYRKLPKACTDITGEYVFWTSNTNTSRLDLFAAKIPKHLLPNAP